MEKRCTCMPPAITLHRLAFLLEKRADQKLQGALDVTFSQCMILHSLKRNPDCSQQCIARCRDLTQAAVSRQIDALRQKKLLVRKENPKNRREHILTMTDNGEEVLREALGILQKTFEEVFSTISAHDLSMLEAMLDRLLEGALQCGKEDCEEC